MNQDLQLIQLGCLLPVLCLNSGEHEVSEEFEDLEQVENLEIVEVSEVSVKAGELLELEDFQMLGHMGVSTMDCKLHVEADELSVFETPAQLQKSKTVEVDCQLPEQPELSEPPPLDELP